MAKRKKDTAPAETEKQEQVANDQPKQAAEKRPPQMVTVNGDKVSHAHVFKSKDSDDWYFTARLNDVPLKPQKASKEDTEAVLNSRIKAVDLMEKYYPSKMRKQLSAEEFKIPATLKTSTGEQPVLKFNAYKEKDERAQDYGKYRFYVQVGDNRMSVPAKREDLNAYFDKTISPKDLIIKVFGEKLHLADHYAQFRLPEGSNLTDNEVRIMKNTETNRYEITADLGSLGKTSSREISYDDRQSFFTHKTASKIQLAAKYLNDEISGAMLNAPKHEQVKQQALSL